MRQQIKVLGYLRVVEKRLSENMDWKRLSTLTFS